MTDLNDVSWFGAGQFAGMSSGSAIFVVGAILIASGVIVAISYRFTLIRLTLPRRLILGFVRLMMVAVLLMLLAAPTRIVRQFDQTPPKRRLAVLVDRSNSMTAPDNRGQRRLDEVVQKWNPLEAPARKTFSAIETYAFAEGMKSIVQVTEPASLPGTRTDLFASLQDVLGRAPPAGWGGIVVLTDGLDTGTGNPDEAQRAVTLRAIAAGTPLYFLVGHNRAMESPFLRLRSWNAPARTNPHSVVRVEAVFESFQTGPLNVPVSFKVNGQNYATPPLRLETGFHTTTWATDVAADAVGSLEMELRAGTEVARSEVQVVRPVSRRILYEAGALDWGYRFVVEILKRSDAFQVTSTFNLPNAGIELPPGTVANFPLTATSLEPYDVVVLANLKPEQLHHDEEVAVSQWVNHGGILFAIVSDADSVRALAGTEIEQALPVVFPANPPRDRAPPGPMSLIPFRWEARLAVDEIFRPTLEVGLDDLTPRFLSFVPIERAKPGAEILARHPSEKDADGGGAILLAVQRYGQGRATVLATDPLWRWKLSQSSRGRGVEMFWQQLFSWLARDRNPALFFDHPPTDAVTGSEIALRLSGGGNPIVHAEARLADRKTDLAEKKTDDGFHELRWRPESAGLWEIRAETTKGEWARCWIQIKPAAVRGELPGGPPDENRLRTLAAETGGAVLDEVPLAWRAQEPLAKPVREHRVPLWHQAFVFGWLIGLYGLELVLRRVWKLL